MEYENLFPLYWICGEWKSNRKSPPVTVFRDGGAYRIALIYHLDAVVVGTIHRIKMVDQGRPAGKGTARL